MVSPTLLMLIAAILICIGIELVKPLVFAKIDERVADAHLNDRALPDLMHSLLPDYRAHYKWGDIVVGILLGCFIGFCIWTGQWSTLVEAFFLWALFILIKLVINAVTILPDPSGMCKEKESLFGKADGQCNDLMPSGHMAIVAIVVFSLWGQANGIGKAGLVVVYVTAALVTLAVRNHYTIDIVVSAILVLALRQALIR
jgi:hypothetical protein